MTVCYLALGSNLGDRAAHLERARAELGARGARILRESTVHETEPFGVIGNIITWNAPMISLAFKVTPSLAAGCTTVVKPS